MSTGASFRTTIAPWLSVRESVKAVEFYRLAFGAVEVFRLGEDSIVARLSIDGAEFWVGEESPQHENFSPQTLSGSTVRMVLTVADPVAMFEQVCKAGGRAIHPVSEMHGWLVGRLVDPFGHHWEIGREVAG
jgi:PhnB protein